MSIYVFGYGSLINMKKNKELINCGKRRNCPVSVKGLKRSLNIASAINNLRFFGVKNNKNALCNGVLFKVNELELDKLIKREGLYTVTKLAKNRIVFNYNKQISFNPEDKIIFFYPNPNAVLSKSKLSSKKVSPEYFKNCLEGSAEISKSFLKDFITTSNLL
jgi:hypothetical protein